MIVRKLKVNPFVMEPNWRVVTCWIHGIALEEGVWDWGWSHVICLPAQFDSAWLADVLGYTRDLLIRKYPDWDNMLHEHFDPLVNPKVGA